MNKILITMFTFFSFSVGTEAQQQLFASTFYSFRSCDGFTDLMGSGVKDILRQSIDTTFYRANLKFETTSKGRQVLEVNIVATNDSIVVHGKMKNGIPYGKWIYQKKGILSQTYLFNGKCNTPFRLIQIQKIKKTREIINRDLNECPCMNEN